MEMRRLSEDFLLIAKSGNIYDGTVHGCSANYSLGSEALTKAGGKITDVTIDKQMIVMFGWHRKEGLNTLMQKGSKNWKKLCNLPSKIGRKLKERREKLRPSRN